MGVLGLGTQDHSRCLLQQQQLQSSLLLDVCLDLWGFEEAIWCKQRSVECMCGAILILVPSAFGDEYLLQGTERG